MKRIMKIAILILTFTSLAILVCSPRIVLSNGPIEDNNEIAILIEDYINLLTSDRPPSKQDFYKYQGGDWELMLENIYCEKRGWTPVYEHPECLNYLKKHGRTSSPNEPSLFFKWLKTVLGKDIATNARYSIENINEVRGKFLGFDVITVKVGNTEIVFKRMVEDREHFGELNLSEINGINIKELLRRYRATIVNNNEPVK